MGTRVIVVNYGNRKPGYAIEDRVMSAKRFREYADECMGWAKHATSDKDRQNYLQMAETWLRAADHYETARPARHQQISVACVAAGRTHPAMKAGRRSGDPA